MKGERPLDFEAAGDLRRMLQQLGRPNATVARDAAQERVREERMASRIDAELEGLVASRRAWRRGLVFGLAVAALVALTLGVRHGRFAVGSPPIAAEPAVTPEDAAPRPTVEVAPSKPAIGSTPASAAPRASAAPVGAPLAASASRPPVSTLAEENRLFKAAAEADRGGDVNGALARLDQLLQEHPASPLAQAAMVRRFRLLAKSGKSDDARREAERYLSSYPTGFAVGEARALTAAEGEQRSP